jgi:hypothetical protein
MRFSASFILPGFVAGQSNVDVATSLVQAVNSTRSAGYSVDELAYVFERMVGEEVNGNREVFAQIFGVSDANVFEGLNKIETDRESNQHPPSEVFQRDWQHC